MESKFHESSEGHAPCLWRSFNVHVLRQEIGQLGLQDISESHGGSKPVANFQA
jgi:hypothetical protein